MSDATPVGKEPRLPVVDPTHPVDYASNQVPPTYRCHGCGATDCKLWREYNVFLDYQTLHCANCAAANQQKSIATIDADGKRTDESDGLSTDTIGWLIPAVPTAENDTYWGYSSVPEDGVDWWRRLPTLPAGSSPVP